MAVSDYVLNEAIAGVADPSDYNSNMHDVEDTFVGVMGCGVVSGGVVTDGGALNASVGTSVYLLGIKLSKGVTVVPLGASKSAGTTNRIWAVTDPDDADRVVYVVYNDATVPARGALVAEVDTGVATITAIRNNPTGRADLVSFVSLIARINSTFAGHVALPLVTAREISANDTINTAGDAGVLSNNTTPKLYRKNAATDKKLLIEWAAANSDEIIWDILYPPDLDDTQPIVFHGLFVMSGSTDTPTVAVSYFEGIGDANAGGNTPALSNVLTDRQVTIAAVDVGPYPNGASIGLVPGAHTTDKVQLVEAWLTYTRKSI